MTFEIVCKRLPPSRRMPRNSRILFQGILPHRDPAQERKTSQLTADTTVVTFYINTEKRYAESIFGYFRPKGFYRTIQAR